MEIFQFLALFVICVAIIIPIINNVYKDNMWVYMKQKLEEENKANKLQMQIKKSKKGR